MLAGLSESVASLGHQVFIAHVSQDPVEFDAKYDRRLVDCSRLDSDRLTTQITDLARQKQIEVLHTHGLWQPINRSTYQAARLLKLPLIWTTHGMLRPWALSHKPWKKRLGWYLFQRKQLRAAEVLHATCEEEADELKLLLPSSKIEVVPIGVELPACSGSTLEKEKILLFMGRLHPVKGLLNLVEAMHLLRPQGWHCVLAGPDEDGFRSVLEAKIHEYGIDSWFTFTGAVSGAVKADLFKRAAVFVLPSYTENFGVVVPEALSYNCPVLTTVAAPWSVLSEAGCGWQVEVGVQPLANQLKHVLGFSLPDLLEMGERGASLVSARFTKQAEGMRFSEIYGLLDS